MPEHRIVGVTLVAVGFGYFFGLPFSFVPVALITTQVPRAIRVWRR